MNVKAISLPADLSASSSARALLTATGIVSFSPEGIKYRTIHFMQFVLRFNLINKFFWKYQVKPIKYDDIVDVLPFKNNCLELVTNRVNGSYFFSVPYSQSGSISDISAFIQMCRDEGFDRAVQDQVLFKNVESHCTKAKRAMILPTIILMLASLVIPNTFIGFLLSVVALTTAKQSGSKILYVISTVLFVLLLLLLFFYSYI